MGGRGWPLQGSSSQSVEVKVESEWGKAVKGKEGIVGWMRDHGAVSKKVNETVMIGCYLSLFVLQVSISQPPSSSSRAPSLLSVEIPLDVIDEIEERKDRERIEWRRSCRLARDQALAREAEARKAEAGE